MKLYAFLSGFFFHLTEVEKCNENNVYILQKVGEKTDCRNIELHPNLIVKSTVVERGGSIKKAWLFE